MPNTKALLLAGLVLTGCTVGPDFERPAWYSPASWFGRDAAPKTTAVESVPVAAPIDVKWWTLFHDPELS